MAGRSPLSLIQVSDANGVPISGAKMNHYATGTSTPQDTYSDDDLLTANANPVVADSEGRFGDIFFLASTDYKVVLTDADDVTIFTADPVRAPSPKASNILSKTTTYTVTSADDGKLIAADATGGAFTITLPSAATAGDGFEITIIKIDSSSNAVTIDGDGSETLNDSSSQSLSVQFDAIELRSDGSEWFAAVAPSSSATPLPRGYINGLEVSNNGTDADHDMDIAAGVARDGGDAANMSLTTTLTKQIDAAWAVGDGNGGLDTGTVGNNTWYYIWLIRRSDTGVTDALFSTSPTAPTMPTNYDQKRRIGSVLTDGSANIISGISGTGYVGGIVQRATYQTGAVATGTTVMPEDDTIPQNTEGDQYMSLEFAPTNADNILEITVVWNGASTVAGGRVGVALFQDSTAGALAAASTNSPAANVLTSIAFYHRMAAGTTSATTFKVRAGPHSAGTVTFNGSSGGRIYGGVMASSITITEYSA